MERLHVRRFFAGRLFQSHNDAGGDKYGAHHAHDGDLLVQQQEPEKKPRHQPTTSVTKGEAYR